MRNVLAVLLGAMVAFGLVSVGDAIAGSMMQLPAGVDPKDRAAVITALEAVLASVPLRTMLTMVAGYFVAASAGGFIARKIATSAVLWPSVTVGLLVLAGTIANFAMISHPTVMVVLGVLAPVPGALLGARLAGRGAVSSQVSRSAV